MLASVVGGGVSGLTVAVRLLEAGWDIRVLAKDTYDSTVSMVAAAVWTAIDLEPLQKTRRWALTSRARFEQLAGRPGTGVVPLTQLELDRHDPGPSWWERQHFVRRVAPDEIPEGYAGGLVIHGFQVEPPIYLRWLSDRVSALGGSVERTEVNRLDDVAGDVVVNCSGLGAASLANDAGVHPIRGQVVAVRQDGIREGISDESDQDRITYVYPRSTEVILGGTRDTGRTDLAPDPRVTERILFDAVILDRRLAGLDVVDVRVGLRPGRPSVRVERDRLEDGRTVIHDYGHAGAGFILSWGCADEVVDLASQR